MRFGVSLNWDEMQTDIPRSKCFSGFSLLSVVFGWWNQWWMACSFPSLGYKNFHINMLILCFSSKAENQFEFTHSLLWNLGRANSNVMKASFCLWSSLLLSRSLAEFDWHGYWCAYVWFQAECDYCAFRKYSPPWIFSHSDPLHHQIVKHILKHNIFISALTSQYMYHVGF